MTAIVAPLAAKAVANADDRAVIPVEIDGASHVVLLQGLAAIPLNSLNKPIAKLPEIAERLPRAIDYLFLGL